MNRSVDRLRVPVSGITPGMLAVGSFRHPDRGVPRFPTATAIAATLRRAGHEVRHHALQPADSDANGVLFAASYLDQRGRPVGLGVAAHDRDLAGLAAAEAAVDMWSGLWRTRRIVPAAGGRCGPGCSHERLIRAEIARFTARGDDTVIIGKPPAGQSGTAIGSAAEADRLRVDPDHVSYVVWPGFVIEDAAEIIAALRTRFPRIRAAHPDMLCYSTSDYRAAARMTASTCDITLAFGYPETMVHALTDPAEIRPEWLTGVESIGVITPAGSDPAGLLDVLSGLGPVSVVRRTVSTEVVSAARSRTVRHRAGAFAAVRAGRQFDELARNRIAPVRQDERA